MPGKKSHSGGEQFAIWDMAKRQCAYFTDLKPTTAHQCALDLDQHQPAFCVSIDLTKTNQMVQKMVVTFKSTYRQELA
jgi:hypothetical protein